MERITRLKNGSFIGIAAVEISAIPDSAIIDPDLTLALKRISSVFAEILNSVSHQSFQQDAALELLCLSETASGQVFEAQLRLFLVLRKYGRNVIKIEKELRGFQASCSAALKSASFVVSDEDALVSLKTRLYSIQNQAVLSLEKQVRIGTVPGQTGWLCFTNPYHAEEISNYSRVYEAMAHFTGMALSFQIIPTLFEQKEISFVQNICFFLDMPKRMNMSAPPQPNDAIQFYRQAQGELDKKQYLYNILLLGSKESTEVVGNRLRSALQHENEEVGLALIDRFGQIPQYTSSFASFPWNMITYKTQHPTKPEITPPHFARMVHMLSASEVMTFFHAPLDDGSIAGFAVNRVRMTRETFANRLIGEDNIRAGQLMGAAGNAVSFGIPLNDFTRHALIVGMPGTGKTTFAINLLLQFYHREIPFLVIEPTKSEFRAMIDAVPELQVFTPGKNSVVPFIINPFLPPSGIALETFKPSLVSAFKAAFSMPSPLDILFSNAIDACYVKYGWRNYSRLGDPGAEPFGLYEFVLTFREILRSSNYSSEIKGNMESAGVFRLLNLIIQNGNIYDTIHSIPLYDLLQKPTVIELNAIDNQEQKSLLMALLLINIVLFTKHNQMGDGKLKNILMIDEAHVLLGSNTSIQEGTAYAAASAVRTLQNMIAEIRSYGTGIIIADQSPQKVTKEVVGNTDVKIMFQLVQAEDKRMIAASANMSEADENQLSLLNTGEAFAFSRGLTEPVRIKTEDIREKEKIKLVVPDGELLNRVNYWCDRQNLLKPYRECTFCSVCETCDFALRDDAKYYVDQFFMKDNALIKEKKVLFAKVINMEKRLKELNVGYEGERFRQLLFCVCVRYIRKAALETPVILSHTETERVLNRSLDPGDDKLN